MLVVSLAAKLQTQIFLNKYLSVSLNGWMVKQTSVHPYHSYHLVIKRNKLLIIKLLIHMTWTNLKEIMLNENGQSQRYMDYMIPFITHY